MPQWFMGINCSHSNEVCGIFVRLRTFCLAVKWRAPIQHTHWLLKLWTYRFLHGRKTLLSNIKLERRLSVLDHGSDDRQLLDEPALHVALTLATFTIP